jgi:hypothetical protein
MRLIRFIVAGDVEYCEERPETFVQLREEDAADLLRWLWLDASDFGFLEAVDLAARCRRRLWPIARNFDPALPSQGQSTANGNVRLVTFTREAGFLRAHTEQLLKLAERAQRPRGSGQILFS